MFALIIFMEYTKAKPINWFPSYASHHKIPYGTYVLDKEFKSLFKNTEVRKIKQAPFEFLKDTTLTGTYFFVDGALNFGKEEFYKLLKFVERGNEVFISTNAVTIDTLGLDTKQLTTSTFKEYSYYKLLNKYLDTTEIPFDKKTSNSFFYKIDTLKTTALGKLIIKDKDSVKVEEGINFIKYNHGKGVFYLHTFPQVFTNYGMLKDNNHTYVASVLSYINDKNTIFYDTYYKTGKERITSKMYYVLNSDSLRWAYYTALIGVLFFVIFKGKRVQRIIPIIKPLKNQTVAFTKTIANMYYEKSEHKSIAAHKINYFLEYIRTHLHIPTTSINKEFYHFVSSRSGNNIEEVQKLFQKIKAIQKSSSISKEQLIELNTLIEKFKNKQS